MNAIGIAVGLYPCEFDVPMEPDGPQTQEPLPHAQDALDVEWMLRVQKGDTAAFQALIEHHQNRVIGTVARMLGDTTDAEDLAQQVFLRIWKSAGRYKPQAKFTTWLYTITRNLVFNESRRRKRHPTESMDQVAGETPRQYTDSAMSGPDSHMLEAELTEAIRTAIQSLPETQRLAIILRRYEELSYEEIAVALSTSVSSVKSLLFRARAELKIKLEKYLAE